MKVNLITRFCIVLLALHSLDAYCATPPASQPTPARSIAVADPTATATPAGDAQNPAQQVSQGLTPEPSHDVPAVVAAQGTSATPKEQAVALARDATADDASGFRLMTLSTNALLSRVSLADQAKRSIDMQYYIFRNDATGRLIALHVLQAADRGVHVRILLDDLNLAEDVRMFDALDSHPNIEVRLFNPFHSRDPNPISKAAQFLLEFRRLNRRMHNKSFIVDNDVAVIGGRNIGDGYFDANVDNNFRDLDLLAIGPVVPAATASFEAYWNCEAAHPLVTHSKTDRSADLVALRETLETNKRKFDDSAYKQAILTEIPKGATVDRPGNWFWGHAALVADEPEKIEAGSKRADLRINPQLKELITSAKSEVLLISPYFIPSDQDEENFIALAQHGVQVKVLTNSLASTDEVAAHEGYSDHRRRLLEGGVQLFELKSAAGVTKAATTLGKSSGVSLHAKSFVVDRRHVFIGSMNMDQRSKLLNTEMGIVVDSPQLAKAVANFFETASLPANAYHVVLGASDGSHPSEIHWIASKDGEDVDYSKEPDTSLHRRLEVKLLKLLPIDSLL